MAYCIFNRNVQRRYAVDARTGKVAWSFRPKSSRRACPILQNRMSYNWGTSRGVAYWKGHDRGCRMLDGRLISLAEESLANPCGQCIPSTRFASSTSSITGAPLVFGDRVPDCELAVWRFVAASRGYVTAYSTVNGRELWRSFTVPGDPARGYESETMKMAASTWGPEWWNETTCGGVDVWECDDV